MARFRGDGSLDESFRAPWAASVIPRYSVVGEANGFVYVREGDIPYGNRVRRFRLSAPGQLDPFYSPDDVQGAVVADENAFLYELYWLGNEQASLRRRNASNVIDANWGSTVPARYIGIGYDSAIGRIFLTTSPSSPQGADVAIVTAGGTIDPDWSLERLPSSVRPGQLYVVGHRPGRLLTRQEVGGRAHLVLHDMATGRIITSASGPSIAQYYFQPAADGSWYATDNTGNVGVPIADPIVRLGPTLERDHTLRTQLRRPGIALHAARGRDGGLFVVGDFQEAGGQARARLALATGFPGRPGLDAAPALLWTTFTELGRARFGRHARSGGTRDTHRVSLSAVGLPRIGRRGGNAAQLHGAVRQPRTVRLHPRRRSRLWRRDLLVADPTDACWRPLALPAVQ
jgi:hypothetical protein